MNDNATLADEREHHEYVSDTLSTTDKKEEFNLKRARVHAAAFSIGNLWEFGFFAECKYSRLRLVEIRKERL